MQVQGSMFMKVVIIWLTELRRLKFYSKRNIWLNVYEALGVRGLTVTSHSRSTLEWSLYQYRFIHHKVLMEPIIIVARLGHAAVLLQGLWVRFPPEGRLSVFCECRFLTGKGLRDGPIPRPKECACVCVCVCVPLSVIRRNNNPLHLQRVGR